MQPGDVSPRQLSSFRGNYRQSVLPELLIGVNRTLPLATWTVGSGINSPGGSVGQSHLVRQRYLPALACGLEDREADLDRCCPPSTVVRGRPAGNDRLGELVDQRVDAAWLPGHRD